MTTINVWLIALFCFQRGNGRLNRAQSSFLDQLEITPEDHRASLIISDSNLTLPPTSNCSVQPQCGEEVREECSCAPNLFLIGSKRVASTSFYMDVVKLFSNVEAGDSSPFASFRLPVFGIKQKSYFDYGYCQDVSDRGKRYLNLWRHGPGLDHSCNRGNGSLHIDFSVTYISDMRTPSRIRYFYRHIPVTPSFLVMLREPTRRYVSEFRHWKGEGNLDGAGIPANVNKNHLNFDEYTSYQLKYFQGCMPKPSNPNSDLAEGIRLCGGDRHYIDGLGLGLYAALLDFWMRYFEPRQFIVLSMSSYLKDTSLTMKALSTRLGVTLEAVALRSKITPTDFQDDHVKREATIEEPDPSVLHEVSKFYEPYNQELRNMLQHTQQQGLQVVGAVNAIFDM